MRPYNERLYADRKAPDGVISDGWRRVRGRGVKFGGSWYWHESLKPLIGELVKVQMHEYCGKLVWIFLPGFLAVQNGFVIRGRIAHSRTNKLTLYLSGCIERGAMMRGSQIKKLRKAYGLTQAELARVLHCSQQLINHWEHELRHPERYDAVVLLRLESMLYSQKDRARALWVLHLLKQKRATRVKGFGLLLAVLFSGR